MQSDDSSITIYVDDILDILYAQSEKNNDPTMTTSTVVQAVISFIRHSPNRFPNPNLRTVPALVIKRLLEAERRNEIIVTREGSAIIRIFFSGYFIRRIKKRLHEIRREPELPFPTSSTLALDIPESIITPVNANDQLIDFMEQVKVEQDEAEDSDEHDNRLIRLLFSGDIDPLLLPYVFSSRDLILICLQKIRFYLRNERNQSYMRQKMLVAFRHREKLVEDTFTAILSRPEAVLEDIWKPNEFSYYFWIQITATINKEYAEKKEKSVNEQNYIHASTLLGMLLAHRKSLLQRENDREQALKQLETQLRSDPYLYTTNDIMEFTDKNGVLLTKKLSYQDVISYIEKEEVPRENEKIPPLVRLATADSRVYVRKDLLFSVFFQRSRAVRERLMKSFVTEWSHALYLGVRLVEMNNQQAFENAVQERVVQIDPVLASMLDFSLLYFASREVPLSEQIKAELRRILDTKKLELKPLSHFFQLDRSNIYSDAKLLLPVWKTIPILSTIIRLLHKMFVGVDREEEAERMRLRARNRESARQFSQDQENPKHRKKAKDSASSAGKQGDTAESPKKAVKTDQKESPVVTASQQREKMRTAAKTIQAELSAGYDSPEEARQAALERWNTIIDRKNRQNLTIDVENLAKDQARRILRKRGSGPPTLERIRDLARNLAKKDVFDSIRDKKSLELFIALTIAKYLRQ